VAAEALTEYHGTPEGSATHGKISGDLKGNAKAGVHVLPKVSGQAAGFWLNNHLARFADLRDFGDTKSAASKSIASG